MRKMENGVHLWVTYDRVEEDERGRKIAVLLFDDGQELHLPAGYLPRDSAPQQVLEVTLRADLQETERRAEDVRRRQQQLFGE
ncbi:MAG TPA: DUF3006 domain-containing protein [Chloroflexota bacterium]|nr:DUF3006 domain-containing protein [Chloroflexota bacterium]